MSMRALLIATRTAILDHLGVAANDPKRFLICDVTDDGRPKPASGQVFYGLVGGSISNSQAQCLDEFYDLRVLITLKAGYSPTDKLGQELLLSAGAPGVANSGGLWSRAEKLRSYLHMRYSVIDAANVEITAAANGFVRPLTFLGASYLGVRGPEWFDAEAQDDPTAGVVMELRFGNAQRIQVIESQT